MYSDIIKNILYLLWSKNSIERLMISSSVIILLSSSATSPRSSLDPLDAIFFFKSINTKDINTDDETANVFKSNQIKKINE